MSRLQTSIRSALLKLAFNGLAEEELEHMAALTDLRTYPPDTVLCHEGAHEEIFYVLAEGTAIISKRMGDDGDERISDMAGKGEVLDRQDGIDPKLTTRRQRYAPPANALC